MTQAQETHMRHSAQDAENEGSQHKLTTTGKILLGISGVVFVGIYAVTSPFISPALRRICLPYVPASPAQIRNVVAALKGRKGSVLDIGSGDGRIVLETAKHGFRSYGVELNIWLVLYARYQAWKHGLAGATFKRKDLWKTDLSVYNNIVIFGVEQMMNQLEEKFDKELNRESQVIACRFPLPTWYPVKKHGHGIDTVWVYKHPSNTDEKRIAKPLIESNSDTFDTEQANTEPFQTSDSAVDNQNVKTEKVISVEKER